MFEYEKHARFIDNLSQEELRDFAKLYCKMYLHQQEVISQAIDELLEMYKDETKRERAVELIKRLAVHKSNCESFIKEYETIMEDTLDIERYGS